MHLSSRRNTGASVEMQMTSMIDVTFLLLIFFMATSGFQKTERELDPSIAAKKSSATRPTSHIEPAMIDIVRGGTGHIYRLGSREFNSIQDLSVVLRKLENKGEGAYVRPDDDAPFDMAASAVQACKSAGFVNVTYQPRGK